MPPKLKRNFQAIARYETVANVGNAVEYCHSSLPKDKVMSQSDRSELIKRARRVVVKLGTAVLMRDEGGIALSRFYSFIEGLAALKKSGREVLLVTSGAVGLGAQQLGFASKPKLLPQKQACAAVGQGRLMALYSDAFDRLGITAAQILLTEEDFSNRQRYLNLRSTIAELMRPWGHTCLQRE